MPARTDAFVARLVRALRGLGDPARAGDAKAYLKSELEFFGVPNPVVRRTTRAALRELAEPTRAELHAAVAALWATAIHEPRTAAIELLVTKHELLDATDLPAIERLLRDAKTWAYVDELAVHVVGPIVERDPAAASTLDRWADDDDLWIRRAAMLALLRPLRRGGGDFARFARYADAMLDEREFFIRKAIGWILRETSRMRPELVFDWLLPRVERASGVTLREAVKHLPAARRERILARRARGTIRAR